MQKLFTEHPASVGETYGEHLFTAGGFAVSMLAAAAACLTHALLPFLFEKTASRMIADLYQRTGPGRVKENGYNSPPEPSLSKSSSLTNRSST